MIPIPTNLSFGRGGFAYCPRRLLNCNMNRAALAAFFYGLILTRVSGSVNSACSAVVLRELCDLRCSRSNCNDS